MHHDQPISMFNWIMDRVDESEPQHCHNDNGINQIELYDNQYIYTYKPIKIMIALDDRIYKMHLII